MTTSISPTKADQPPAPPVEATRRGFTEIVAPYAYIAPFFVLFAVFGLIPLLFTFYVALFDWNPIGEHVFVGLDNFTRLLGDVRF